MLNNSSKYDIEIYVEGTVLSIKKGVIVKRIVFLLFLLFGSFTYATEVGKIAGVVVDRTTRQPLPGVNVSILGTEMGAATDIIGRYLIENIPIGEYSIQANMMGYKPLVKIRIYPIPNRTISIDFELEQTILEMKGITVTPEYFPKEKDAVVSSHKFSFHEARGNPEGYNVQRMLASLPGVGSVEDYSAQLIVRGGDPDENLCLIDNVEIGSPVHFGWFGGEGGSISIINTDLVKSIGFSSGGFPAKYGDKLSSFMDIHLKEGNKDKLEVNFDFNMSRMGFDLGGPVTQKASYLFSYGRSYLELLDKISDIGNVIPKYDEIWGKIVYEPSYRDKFSTLGFMTIDRMTVPKSEMGRDAKGDLIWNGEEGVVSLSWRTLVSDRGFSSLAISGISHSLDLDCENTFGVNSTQSQITIRENFTYRFSSKIDFEAGGSYKYLNFDWYSFFAPETTSTGIPIPGETISEMKNSYKVGSYIQTSFSPFPIFQIKPGVRYDYFDLNTESVVSPRIGFKLSLSEITFLSFSYGEFYQFPSYENLLSNNLKSKHAVHYVVGIEHLITPNTKLTIEGYTKKLNNLITAVSDSTRYLDNSGEGYIDGVDILLHKKLAEKVFGSVSYSYSMSERKDRWGERDYFNGEYYSDWDQRNIFTIIGGYQFSDNLELTIKWRYASGRPYTPVDTTDKWQDPVTGKWYIEEGPINSARYPAYHRLDFQIAQRHIFKGWSIVTYFNIQNVYNRKNILEYSWNDDFTEREELYQFLFMPVGGVTIEF